MRWHNFNEYVVWREAQDVHTLNPDEALAWVLSVLGIKDNYNPNDANDRKEVQEALASPLSAYPDKLERLQNEPQLQTAPNWPDIQAAIGSPDKTSVSELASVIGSAKKPDKTITDKSEPEVEGEPYQEPDGRSPL